MLLENPQLIRDVHLDYFRAGAQVAITASYQATPAGFAARGLDEAQSRALIGKSVELARKARRRISPKTRRPARCWWPVRWGRTARIWPMARSIAAIISAARRVHGLPPPRVSAALLDAGADLLACETLPSFREIKALAACRRPRARHGSPYPCATVTLSDPERRCVM